MPAVMRGLQLREYGENLANVTIVDNLPVPKPGPGEVLVRVAASPLNPSDLAFLVGMYGFKKRLPAVPGFEGSGTVVASGSGVMARFLKGRRVACTVADPKISGGMWAEYVVTRAELCVPLSKKITLEQGSMMLVNPLTAWAMLDEAQRAGHEAVVQTAAASAVGKMVVRLGHRLRVPVVNVVRRAEQVEMLRQIGAEHILNSSDPGFDAELKKVCAEVNATCCFDAVGGELAGRVLRAQPRGSRIFVYGGLSLKPCEIDVGSLIFEGKVVAGFWISAWLERQSLMEKIRIVRQAQSLLASDLKSDVQAAMPLEDAAKAISRYKDNMSAGKVLLIPNMTNDGSAHQP